MKPWENHPKKPPPGAIAPARPHTGFLPWYSFILKVRLAVR
jgi:hypothetical protein